MRKWIFGLIALLVPSVLVLANPFNSWQPFQPFKNNYIARNSNAAPPPLPDQANIIFQHNIYDGSATPQVGSYTYTRSGTITANNTTSTVASYAADTLPFGMRWGGTETMAGAWLGGGIKNWILYSEELNNAAWTAVGGGAASANTATAPDGTVTADTISGSTAGDGITQDSGTAAGSVAWVGSVWLKTSSGSQTVKLVVKDAGTQQGFTEVVVTTAWKRFQVPKLFYSATGNSSFQIIVGNTSTVRGWGSQLERFNLTNTVGSRDRRSSANAYVKTTSAVATTGTSNYSIDNTYFSQLATTGSISFWVMADYDWQDLYGPSPAGIQYFFGANYEQWALTTDITQGFRLWLNNATVASSYGTSFNNTTQGISPDRWTHILVSWNTGTDVYKIFLNGVDVTGPTTTSSAITTSTYVMNIGGNEPANFPYVTADALMSQVVIWKSDLDATEALQVYQNKEADATRATVGEGLLFEVALGTSPIPTTGDKEYFYAHRTYGTWYYPDSTTTLAPVSQATMPQPAYPLNGYNKAGLAFQSNNQNLILQSEDIGTTWASVTGSPTITAAGGTFLGTLNYGTILGVSGEGIKQAIVSTAGDKWTASTYASVAAGTLAARLTLIRDGSETVNQDITLTTTPQRFNIYADFTSTPATGVEMQFTLQAAGTARVGGFMLESADTTPRGVYAKVSTPYQKTTTTAVTSGWSGIVYRGTDSLNPNKGSAIAWAYLDGDPGTDYITSNGPTLMAANGQYGNLYWHVLSNQLRIETGGQLMGTAQPFSATARTWYHWAATWETAGGNCTTNLYLDGVLVDNETKSSAYLVSNRKFMIGADGFYGPMDYWSGAIDSFKIYGGVKDATFILADFDATKAAYGR